MSKRLMELATSSMLSGIFLATGTGIGPLDIASIVADALASSQRVWQIVTVILSVAGIWETINLALSFFHHKLVGMISSAGSFFGVLLLFWTPTQTLGALVLAVALIIAYVCK